ncbi:MAG: ABC transporter substrate-binding protein [Alphaproteobacteria bacterium]|nr:ABC transporter substrate-binding protein [Alphaproteobacteria bacterium]
MRRLFTIITAALAVGLAAGAAEAGQKVKIGTEGAYPPFNSIDKDGKLVGFDVDIAKAVCAAAEFECEFVVQDWDGIIPGLIAKKYDAIVASMSITEERKQKVDFTDKYYNTPAKFVARKGADLKITIDGLKGKVVAVQRATIHENFLRDNFGDVVTVNSYATQDEAYLDLVSGRADAGIADSVAIMDGFLSTDQGKDFQFYGPDFNDPKWFGEGVGIAVRKGDNELREKLNAAIRQIRSDGTYKKINAKYFDFDVYGK